jgi:hypothetical protein
VGERGALAVVAEAALFFVVVVVALSSFLSLLLLPLPLPEPLPEPPAPPPPKPDPLLELGGAPTAESVDAPESSFVSAALAPSSAAAASSPPPWPLTARARSSAVGQAFHRQEASPPPSIPARVSPRSPSAPRKTEGVSKSKI